jgi:hypothetical protein
MAYSAAVNKALRNLVKQNISVSKAAVGPQGHTFDVMGYMLTVGQIVELDREKKLNAKGIREFAKNFELGTKE